MLNDKEKEILLLLVENTIKQKLGLQSKEIDPGDYPGLNTKKGAFVTLKIDGQLRGCIGYITGFKKLWETIKDLAVASAFHDPRFPALTAQEMDRLEIEISVLSELTEVTDFSEIRIGIDGLYIKDQYKSGLLLPQVATECGWSVEEFLEHTSLKAGMGKDAYKRSEVEVYKFSALVF